MEACPEHHQNNVLNIRREQKKIHSPMAYEYDNFSFSIKIIIFLKLSTLFYKQSNKMQYVSILQRLKGRNHL